MLTVRNKSVFKVAFIALILALMLLNEPVLAKKGGNKSNRGNRKSQKVNKSSAPKVRQSQARKNNRNAAVVSKATKSTTKVRNSKTSRKNSPKIKSTLKVHQSSSVSSSTTTSSITGSSTIINSSPKHSSNAKKGRSVIVISSGKTSNISRAQPTVTSNKKSPASGKSSRISSAKTSSIISSVGGKTSPASTTKQPVIRSGRRISTDKSQTIVSPISKQKPTKAIVQPVRTNPNKRTKPDKNQTVKISKNKKSKPAAPAVTPLKNKKIKTKKPVRNNSSDLLERARVNNKRTKKAVKNRQKNKKITQRVLDKLLPNSKKPGKTAFNNLEPSVRRTKESRSLFNRDITGKHRYKGKRSSHRPYRERSQVVKHIYRHKHVYRDRHHRIRHRIIWPKYNYVVYYNWGPYFKFRPVYPYYLRKYVFVSIGGYWPIGYRHTRYYWYGCHPYSWYGYYPIASEIQGDTYNYYTYNYYNGTAVSTDSYQIEPVDHTTFADVRERLAQQQDEPPAEATAADTFFDEGVEAFGEGDYETAVEKFANAMELAPDDMILPFAYSQALLANEQYLEAAEVLRTVLAEVSPEQEGVFYPRGLYPDEDVLFEHIERLADMAATFSFDADLQLLLGYQLLGIGETDQAVEPLLQASLDLENAPAANTLIELLEKIKAGDSEAEITGQ